MKPLREGQYLICKINIPEKGLRKGLVGIIKIVTDKYYYIEFKDYPYNLVKINLIEINDYFSKHKFIKC